MNHIDEANYFWTVSGGGTIVSELTDTISVLWGENPGLYRISASSRIGECESPLTEFWVLIQPPPKLILSVTDTTICAGDTLMVQLSGADAYYGAGDWLNDSTLLLSPESNSTYIISGRNQACSVQSEISVGVIYPPLASFEYEQTNGYHLNFTNTSIDAESYKWYWNRQLLGTSRDLAIEFPYDGSFNITLLVTNRCGQDSIIMEVVVIKTGITNFPSSEISIFPQPVTDWLHINERFGFPGKSTVALYEGSGRLVWMQSLPQGVSDIKIYTGDLSRGVYFLRLLYPDRARNYKLIKG